MKVFFSSDECPYFNHYQKYVHKYYCLLLRLVGQGVVVWWMVLEKEHVWTGAMLVFLLAVTKE